MSRRLPVLVLALAAWVPTPAPAAPFEVRAVGDVPYYDGEGAHKTKHKLDLYLPKDQKDFPVVLFVHGGAWVIGDKKDFGIYEALGKMFARQGIGAAVTNYRLSPGVKHPEHVKDVARAFAWVHKNIQTYGGRPDQLFVCGHSAGGHLVSLLATDPAYLAAEGLSLKDVKGALPISGVYGLPDNMLKEVFGTDAEVRKAAGPVNQVREGCPPFLILYADKDYPFCDVGSEAFARALRGKKVPAQTQIIKDRNHIDVILRASREDDPCGKALVEFIRKAAKR
jgi:acetyl esterase/lipase